jgi:periplasmic protein TonB
MNNPIKSDATIEDILFQDKNKAYGAYDLRKTYLNTLNRSFVIGSIAFVTAMALPTLYTSLKGTTEEKKVTLADPLKIPPPPVDKPVPPPPPPPPVPPPVPKVSTTKFLPPEIKPDEDVKTTEPPPTVTELKEAPAGEETIVGDPNAAQEVIVEETGKKEEIVEIKPVEEQVFTVVEQNAEFPGGPSALRRFLEKNLNYPPQAQRANISGRVFCSFVVDRSGNISDVKVDKGIGFGLDEEAKRVIEAMPRWNPGKQSGRAVKSKFNLPIVFQLE